MGDTLTAKTTTGVILGIVAVVALLAFISQDEVFVHENASSSLGSAEPSGAWFEKEAEHIAQKTAQKEEKLEAKASPHSGNGHSEMEHFAESVVKDSDSLRVDTENPVDTVKEPSIVRKAEDQLDKSINSAMEKPLPQSLRHRTQNKAEQLTGAKLTVNVADSADAVVPETTTRAVAVEVPSAALKKQILPADDAWMKMHLWWIKAKEYAVNYADVKAAHNQCLLINLDHQVDCGVKYCDAGEHSSCGGLCKKGDRGHIYLTPLNDGDFYQASEKDVKERKEKKHARMREQRIKAAKAKEIEGKKISAAKREKVSALQDKLDAEAEAKAAFKKVRSELQLKAVQKKQGLEKNQAAARATEKQKKLEEKTKMLTAKDKVCHATAKKTKDTCAAVEKGEKQKQAAGSAKLVHEEKVEEVEAADNGAEALSKEQAQKAAAHAAAVKELKNKEDEALPPGLKRGKFKWDFAHPCDAGAGEFTKKVKADQKVTVGAIPKGKMGLRVDLKSPEDVDIQLYDGVNNKAIIAFMDGQIDSADQTCDTYEGMKVCYSGYNGQDFNYGNEWITVEGKTTRPLILKAYGFNAGKAKVLYKWKGQGAHTGCKNPVVPPVVPPSKSTLKIAQASTGSGVFPSLLQSGAPPAGPEGVRGRFLLQVSPGTEASHTCDMATDETSCTAAGSECKWDAKTQKCSGPDSMVKEHGVLVPAHTSGSSYSSGSVPSASTGSEDTSYSSGSVTTATGSYASTLIHATEKAMDAPHSPTPASCEDDAKEAYDICKNDNEKKLDEEFSKAEKEAKHASNQVVAKEAEAKVQKSNNRAKKEANHKKNKAKIVTKLDKAKATWQKEKQVKSKELAKKAEKEAALVAKEKAKKASAPERDAKERELKAQPKCKAAKDNALVACQHTTNHGYLRCAEIFEKVHMAKTPQRPYNSIEGDIDVHDVVMSKAEKAANAGNLTSVQVAMQTLETGPPEPSTGNLQYHELEHIENHYDRVNNRIDVNGEYPGIH